MNGANSPALVQVGNSGKPCSRRGFTLVELLTVVAIIALLIGILVPSLTKARDQAKNVKTRATLSAIEKGLEMFKSENEDEISGEGYPDSTTRDDPTESGQQNIFGSQWLVRYLMGKDLNGYVRRRDVPQELIGGGGPGWEQKGWYDSEPGSDNKNLAPLPRTGLYLPPEGVKLVTPNKLPGYNGPPPTTDENSMKQLVIVDTFGYPVLYYAANARAAARANAAMASYGDVNQSYEDRRKNAGIFDFGDNAIFTGQCRGTSCTYPPWDFTLSGRDVVHEIENFGKFKGDVPNRDEMNSADNKGSFCYYILNRNAFETTGGKTKGTVTPNKRDAFLLITAGKDGVYGTSDDVTNFQQQ